MVRAGLRLVMACSMKMSVLLFSMTSTILDTTQLCRAVSLKSAVEQVAVAPVPGADAQVEVRVPANVLRWIQEDPDIRTAKWLDAVEQATLSQEEQVVPDPEAIVRKAFESVNKIAIDQIADADTQTVSV